MPSPRQFFNSLDLKQLDAESANYITTEILADARLDLLPSDTDEYAKVVELLQESYPKALGEIKPEAKAEEKKEEPKGAEAPTKELLQARLKNLKKMLAKQPDNKLINSRIKNLEKRLLK